MFKTIVGIDIGYNRLKLVLMAGKKVKKSVVVDMPDKMVRQGRIVSVEAMGELIRDTMKKNRIHCNHAAVLLSNESIFIRNVVMPIMTADQLVYNLPYEFRDYITDELKNYVFDYAMQVDPKELLARAEALSASEKDTPAKTDENQPEGEEGQESQELPTSMELLAVAAPVELMQEIRDVTKKAGLHLIAAAPSICGFSKLLKNAGMENEECCILDLGYQSIRMYMFKGDCHMVTRELEFGLSRLDEIISELFNVDQHLAHTYLLTNHENCQTNDACKNFFTNTAVELMRAVNFYQFSNPDSRVQTIYVCGGGARITPLIEDIRQTLDLNLVPVSSLIHDGEKQPDCEAILAAAGLAMS